MPGQLSRSVKESRAAQAAAVGKRMRDEFMQSSIGSTLSVLFETEEDGICTGHSDSYLPVSVKAHNLRGKTLDIVIRSYENGHLQGEVL